MRHWMNAAFALTCFAGFAEARTAEGLGEATTGITYFNRPGATLEEHQAALDRCAPAVRAMSDPNILLFSGAPQSTYDTTAMQYGAGPTAGAVLILAMVDAARLHAAEERAEHTHYQNCMVAQGWRVVRLENTAGRRMSRMRPSELAEQLAPMIAAAEPEGVIEREFTNDLAYAGSVTPVPTRDGRFISLSRLVLPSESEAAVRRREPRRSASARTREENAAAQEEYRRQREEERRSASGPVESTATVADKASDTFSAATEPSSAATEPSSTPTESSSTAAESPSTVMEGGKPTAPTVAVAEPSSLPQDATLVVFRQRGVRGGVLFRRLDQDGAERESFVVGAMDAPSRPAPGARRGELPALEDTVTALPVQPGLWRMESMQIAGLTVSLCVGSPAFELTAGEVVYVGDFNFGAEPFLPDLSLAPAQETLAETPHFAERLRAASYTNGSTGLCGRAQHVYAYETPASQPETAQPAAAPTAN